MKLNPFIIVLLSCGMVGCGLFSTDTFVDSKTDKDGNVILLDTPRMWNDFLESVHFRIANEKAGKRPEAGANSWNDFWVSWIHNIGTSGGENHEKYMNYIINRRRQEGLPQLDIPEA